MPQRNLLRWQVVCALAGLAVLVTAPLRAGTITGGPSVRVNPNDSVEFAWITDVAWFGKLEVFDNASGGTPVLTRQSRNEAGDPIIAQHHVVTVPVGNPLALDTGYFFQVTATDPTGNNPDVVTPTPLPPLFTGAQAIGNVSVLPGLNNAMISWDANVIGFGQVDFGLATPGDLGTLTDGLNITDHGIELTGLAPGTTYQFHVSNLHAIDGDALVEASGSFTTAAAVVPLPAAATAGLALLGFAGLVRRGRAWAAERRQACS